MALQPCLTCQAMISRRARRCPQCGEPHPHTTPAQGLIGVVLVIVVAAGMFAFMQYRHEEDMRNFQRGHQLPQ